MPHFMEFDLDTNLGKLMDLDFLVQYIICYMFSGFKYCLWKMLWS